MTNKEINLMVSRLWKALKKLSLDSNGDASKYDFEAEERLKKQLQHLCSVVGGIEVMSKNSLLKLVSMQSTHRFMENHTFMVLFSKACDSLKF